MVLGNATVTDDSGEELFAMPDPNGPFPLGETEVIWRATDSAGNTGTDTQFVTITAALAPLDLDIAGFTATKRVRIGRSQSVDFTLRIRNASGNDVNFGRATLVGRLGATEVYRVTVMGVADPPGGGWTAVDLPPFTPDASMAGGTIIWEVTIQDGDPDDDVATATTTVVP